MKASSARSTITRAPAASAVSALKPPAAVHTSSSPRSATTTQPARALFSALTPGMALAVISRQPAGSRHALTVSRSCAQAYARKAAPSPAPTPQYPARPAIAPNHRHCTGAHVKDSARLAGNPRRCCSSLHRTLAPRPRPRPARHRRARPAPAPLAPSDSTAKHSQPGAAERRVTAARPDPAEDRAGR